MFPVLQRYKLLRFFLRCCALSRKAPSMHDADGDMAPNADSQKDNEDGRASGLARTRCGGSNKGRPSCLVPPPSGSPPSVAPPREGGVIKQRLSSKAHGGRRDGFGLIGGRQRPGRSSDSDSDSGSSRSSNSGFSISEVRDRHYISDSSSNSSGKAGKTYLAVDDLMGVENDDERRMGSGKHSEYSRKNNGHSYKRRDGKPRRLGRDLDDGQETKSSRDRAEGDRPENEHHRRRPSSSSRYRTHGNKDTPPSSGWAERSAARAAGSALDRSDDDDGDEDDDDGSCFHRRNSGRSIKSIEKARGSETTATPSPRDHPSGYGEPLVEGVNEGVMGWLADPAADSSCAQRNSTGPSAHTMAHPHQETVRPSLDALGNAHDSGHGHDVYEPASVCTPQRIFDGVDVSGDLEAHSGSGQTSSSAKNHPSDDHNGMGGSTENNKVNRSGGSVEKRRSRRRSPGRR